MESKKFKCEIITPMFMYGADGRTPEIRPSEIKGMMRFWWRAVTWIPGQDNENLLKKESEIFGSSDEKIGSSKFRIRIKENNLQTDTIQPLPHKINAFRRRAFIRGHFIVEFLGEEINTANQVFTLSCLLGGFGYRSRRGFGKILPNQIQFESIKDYLSMVEELLKEFNTDYYYDKENSKILHKNESEVRKEANYPVLTEMLIGKSFDGTANHYNSFKALACIGECTHVFNLKGGKLGAAKPRFASPYYVSVIPISDKFYITLAKLAINPPENIRDFSNLQGFEDCLCNKMRCEDRR